MKKKLLKLALSAFVFALPLGAWADGSAAVKSWDFTTALSSTDVTNLNADGTNWDLETKYRNKKSITDAELVANSVTIAKTAGLKFTLNNPNRVRLNADGSRLELLAAGQKIKIEGLTAGQMVYIISSSNNSSEPTRYLAATSNLTVKSGFTQPSTYVSRVYNAAAVTADGSVEFTSTNGAVYIYSIAVYNVDKSYTETNTETVTNTTDNLLIERTFQVGKWNTLCLPYSLTADEVNRTFGAGTKVADYTSESANTLTFTVGSTVTRGKPCLIKPALATSGIFRPNQGANRTAADVEHGNYTFTGIYAKTVLTTNDYYFATNNTIKKANGTNNLKAFRAYMKYTGGTPAHELTLAIEDNGETTYIRSVDVEGLEIESNSPVYNLKGQKMAESMENLPKGVYVKDGKKFVIK